AHPGEEPVQPGPVEDGPVDRDRVLAGAEDDEAADDEREDRRRERQRDSTGALPDGEALERTGRVVAAPGRRRRLERVRPRAVAHATASFRRPPPVIAIPSSCSSTVGG